MDTEFAQTATPVAETSTEVPSDGSRRLNRAEDRCDQCRAEGFMLFVKNGSEFVFCGHHGREHEPTLASQGWTVFDQTDQINKQPSPSATKNN